MKTGLTRELIAIRVAKELRDGMYVNLGFGMPTLVCDFIPQGMEVTLHSQNGILGYGRIAREDEMDIDLLNASAQPVTLVPGASFFHHTDSFAMIRGGHLDITVLGAYQVSEKGDLANWIALGQKVGAIGGAMDLVAGAKKTIIVMEHTTPSGEPKIVKECSYPLTGRRVVNTIVTNLALIEVSGEGLVLRELAPGITAEEVQAHTEPKLILGKDLKEMVL